MTEFFWTSKAGEAKREQKALAELVRISTPTTFSFSHGRGLAIGTAYQENTKEAVAAGLVFDRAGNTLGDAFSAVVAADFPYIPGLLAFRVGPAVCRLLDSYDGSFDLLLFDGQGIAHQRRFGLASHIGVLYNVASIGFTRASLYGEHLEPPPERLSATPISDPHTNEEIGYSVRLGPSCAPFFMSPGHLISLRDTLTVLTNLVGSRGGCFPHPLQQVHAFANAIAKKQWYNSQHVDDKEKGDEPI